MTQSLNSLSSHFAVFTYGKRDLYSAQLTLHGWGSCEDFVKIGECCLVVVTSLSLTIYLVVFPQNLFTKVMCDPVHTGPEIITCHGLREIG